MPIHDLWSYDHAVQGTTDLSVGTNTSTYQNNGPYNQYTNLPGFLYKNTYGSAPVGTDGFLALVSGTSGNAPALIVKYSDVQDWTNYSKYWVGFRTKFATQSPSSGHVFKLVDTMTWTNSLVLLTEADMTAAGATTGAEQYVEVFLDRINLLYEVWINGVKVKNGSIPAAAYPSTGYFVWGTINSAGTSGASRSFRDYYFVDVDPVQTPGRLGSIRSSLQPQPVGTTPSPLSPYNATLSSAQSKFGGSSLTIGSATNAAAATPDRPALRLGVSGDCTIECWVYWNGTGATPVVFGKTIGTPAPYAHLTYQASNSSWLLYTDSSTAVLTMAAGSIANTWVHMAVVKSGTTWTVYQNGVALGSVNNNGTLGNNASPFYVGNWGGLGNPWQGYIDEFRISNVARYTANFTPSAVPFTPDANTVALWHMDTLDSLGRIPDDTPQTAPSAVASAPNSTGYSAQLIGSAAQFTTLAKFGTACLTLGGSTGTAGSCAQIADTPNLRLTGDYTVEFFAFSPTLGGSQMYVNKGTNAYIFMSGTQLLVSLDPANSAVITVNNALKAGVWQHIALTRFGALVTLWVDGVAVGSATLYPVSSTFGNVSNPLQIGTWNNNTDLFQGYIDEFRISNVARYTAAFTPPSQAFVADANTVALLHFEAVTGGLVADDALTFAALEAQAFPSPPGLTPLVASSPTNDPMTVPFASTNFTGKCLAVDFRLAAKANNTPVSMSAALVQGSNNQALATQQFPDTSMNFGLRLGLQQTAPDGGAWTPAKINATSLTLTPNT